MVCFLHLTSCTLEKHLSLHLQPGMVPQRQPHADQVNQSLQVLFGADTLGNRSNSVKLFVC